nr:endonuclease/exonuclease/phosphatase family protein [Aquicoccus porphyridii]
MLRDILKGNDQSEAVAEVIARVRPDILLLLDIDFDFEARALGALNARIAAAGHRFDHAFTKRPNSGMATDLDLDGDGRRGGPGDAQGFGRFAGEGGMAVLSRWPIGEVTDLSGLIWGAQPWAIYPEVGGRPYPSDEAKAVQRLSSVAHWVLPVETPEGRVTLAAFHATPSVFDGPEDRNGRRNHDEIMLWRHWMNGDFGQATEGRFIILGDANLDPVDGDGIKVAIRGLLGDARLQDPLPKSPGAPAEADPEHEGNPALDTVDWPGPDPGNLRVDYVLPSADFRLRGAGVFWPAPGEDGHDLAQRASRHRLVWVDLEF